MATRPHRIGITVGRHILVLDRVSGMWRLWLSHNTEMTAGTLLELANDGSVTRIVIEPDGMEDYQCIAPPEG